jgi:Zn-dependent alcohol dehydrogenase
MGEPVWTGAEGESIGGRFFGQSSFAKHAIVSGKSVVNLQGLNLSRDDLKLLAPLGCGLQTGSGTVINVAKAGEKDVIAIVGMGGVGLAAVMAAKNAQCRIIIGIDRLESRLSLAKSLGATHTFNTSDMSMDDLVKAVKEVSEGLGTTISIDTSAFPPLVQAQIDFSRYMGRIIQVGTGMPESYVKIHMQSFMVSAKKYFGAVQGHCTPKDYIPQMVRWWREGQFPVENLVKMFEVEDFASAVKVMGSGDVVKPIIVW